MSLFATPSKTRGFDLESIYAGPAPGSLAASDVAQSITQEFEEIDAHLNRSKIRATLPPAKDGTKLVVEQLFDALVGAKVLAAQVAMHLDRDWRNRLFAKLDDLLDAEDWHEDDKPMQKSSFATFLRAILHLEPKRQPSLGISNNGHLLAAWVNGKDRLTFEFLPQDIIRWTLSCDIDGELERAVGETPVRRLRTVIDPYSPDRWFADAPDAPAAG